MNFEITGVILWISELVNTVVSLTRSTSILAKSGPGYSAQNHILREMIKLTAT
jgi:hypothetical protein